MLRTMTMCVAVSLSATAHALPQDKPNDFGGATPIHPDGWITNNDYPLAAKRAHKTGLVQFAFDINLQGRAEHCRVTRSSGNEDLDAAPCALIEKRGRFELPTDDGGKPYPTKGRSQVLWRL